MSSGPVTRRSYEESCRLLQRLGYPDAGTDAVIPPMPEHRPQCGDDAPLGVSFFRTFVGQDIEQGDEDVSHSDLENLTLPRTFFGKSYIQQVSFKNNGFRGWVGDAIVVQAFTASGEVCELWAAL